MTIFLSVKMAKNQFNFFKELLKNTLNQIKISENNSSVFANEIDEMTELKTEKIAESIRSYLLIRKIQEINELWKTIVSSRNKNSIEKFNKIIENLEKSRKNSNDDLFLINMLNKPSLWSLAAEKIEQNVTNINIYLEDWIQMFDIKTTKSDNSTQTDFPFQIAKDMGTQTSYSEPDINYAQRLSKNANIETKNISKKIQKNKIPKIDNKSVKKNNENAIYNVNTKNYYEKLSTQTEIKQSSIKEKKLRNSKKYNLNENIKKNSIVVESSNIKPKTHRINRDQATLKTEKNQRKWENKTDFNAATSKFDRKSYSPSLQRRKWTETQNRNKEHHSDNQWKSHEKRKPHFERQGTYYSHNRRQQAENSYSFKNNEFRNKLPTLLTTIFIKWLGINLNQSYGNYNYQYRNFTNRNVNRSFKVLI